MANNDGQKKTRAAAFIRLLYGFIGIVVSVISIVACIVYSAPLYLIVGFISLLVLSILLIVSGKNLYKNQ